MQIHCRHLDQCRQRQIGVTLHQGLHCRAVQRPAFRQQLGQGTVHRAFATLGRQLQNLQVCPARQPFGQGPQQLVICLTKTARRKQVRLVTVARKRPGFAHQPVDHMAVIDAVFVLATQPRQGHLQLLRVPHLDRLGAHARFQPFPFQTRRHRVDVVLHPDRAPLADLDRQPHQALQATCRQGRQLRQLLGQPLTTPRVTSFLHRVQKPLVVHATGKIPAATQQQRLLDSLLETPMALLAVAVLVATRRVRRFRRHPIVRHERPVVLGERFRIAVRMHRQGHPIRAMPSWHAAQHPQRVLQAFAQAGKTL